MKDFKDKLRSILREQEIPDVVNPLPAEGGQILSNARGAYIKRPYPLTPSEKVAQGKKDPPETGGPSWFKPGQVVTSKPNTPWKPAGSGGSIFHHQWPNGPPETHKIPSGNWNQHQQDDETVIDDNEGEEIPQDIIDAIIDDPGNMDEILDDYIASLAEDEGEEVIP